ncbi:MAG: hypothetical protein IJX18_02875 [Clostridia bacterium]|nr:hypothetical protein [Clostridia bacterium]
MKHLRIIFTAICAVCIALLFPMGMIFGWIAAGICLFSAFLSFGLMLLCKQSQKEEPNERFSPLPQEDKTDEQKDNQTK